MYNIKTIIIIIIYKWNLCILRVGSNSLEDEDKINIIESVDHISRDGSHICNTLQKAPKLRKV